MNIIRKITAVTSSNFCRSFSVSAANSATHSCKLLVIGGGSGGCTVAAKFARRLKAKDSVIVLEPSKDHYYQPLFTLVGAGAVSLESTRRDARAVLPTRAKWIQDSACKIDPEANCVHTNDGHVINYEYVVIATGLVMDYNQVPGMWEALEDKNSGVSSIYTTAHCEKTWSDIRDFKGGEALFTFPKCTIKCPGAPQKIAYLADSYFTKSNVRSKTHITYTTCTPAIFGVKKYSDALEKVAARKNIDVHCKTVLKEIKHDTKEAVFHLCDDEDNTTTRPYDLLHVVPHMCTPSVIRCNEQLRDKDGYLDVDKFTLQHTKFPNVYGIGDCTNTPNSKTGAAVAKQCYVLEHNLLSTMKNDSPKEKYDGYGACPLLTSYNTCILAEFLYGGVVHETFPFDQSKESVLAFYMKKHLFPFIYWHVMLKGYYHGPEMVRKIVNPFGCMRHVAWRHGGIRTNYTCKLLVVGGGTGGCNIAWRFSRRLKEKDIIVLEPCDIHYYQPGFTLVGAGIRDISQVQKPLPPLLPPGITLLRDTAVEFDPCNSIAYTRGGEKIVYDCMVVAVGLQNDYDKVKGLKQALTDPNSRVSTIYSPQYCTKTWNDIKQFKGGHAVFTFPGVGGKCPGAALKILYLAEDYWRKHKIRCQTSVTYNTARPATFGVAKYSRALTMLALNRNIVINYCADLVEVTPNGALFAGPNGELISFPYNLLHVTPYMTTPECLTCSSALVNDEGFLNVDMYTLQHKHYCNIFGLGDCLGTPNSKTAAAIGPQSYVVERNLVSVMNGKQLKSKYNGYGACALLTSYNRGLLAEYAYNNKAVETFPFDQTQERRMFYRAFTSVMPLIYWRYLIKGKFNGPGTIRRIINPLNR
ncbi:sulfide quinone oxidoreductase [Anticarsia gemmatalis]|uniref:sulfide quinone oxidoreductase n=1 Tax=Anticarsia gemmatalis TaxID=129554 RepID=UPI003F76CBAD